MLKFNECEGTVEDLKIIFAQNLIMLRKQMKLTQIELADKIHYSDKAVSKWERGESIPDVSVLMAIAELFGVTIDFLVTHHENAEIAEEQTSYAQAIKKKNRLIINAITIISLIVFEVLAFIILITFPKIPMLPSAIYCFVCPLPAIALVEIIFSSLWANRKIRIVAVSAFIWSLVIEAFVIVILTVNKLFFPVFAVGALGQIIVILSFNLKKLKR